MCSLGSGLSASAGCTSVELDINNANQDYFGVPPPGETRSVGLLINGAGTYTNNAGIYVTSTNNSFSLWDYGIVVGQASLSYPAPSARTSAYYDATNSPASYTAIGNHTYGIHLGGATFTANAFDSPGFSVNSQGQVFSAQYFTTPKTSPSVLTGCSAGAIIVAGSSNNAGQITTGTGTVTSCVMNFSVPWTVGSSCTASSANSFIPFMVASSVAQIALTFQSSAPSTVWTYHCDGQ